MLLIRAVHFFTKVLGSLENGSNRCKNSLIKKGFIMYKNILVPTDLSDKSKLSIQTALELAVESSACVELLHVVEKVGGEPDDEIEGFYLKLAEEASEKLEGWQQQFQENFKSVPINKTILVGKRTHEILSFCQEKEIDLIVMTSRIFNQETQGVGTVSHQVSLLAPVSVLVVR